LSVTELEGLQDGVDLAAVSYFIYLFFLPY